MSEAPDVLPPKLIDKLCKDKGAAVSGLLELLDPLSITLRGGGTQNPRDDYGAVAHSELCRFKVLGLSDENCAKAVGIGASTLRRWLDRYPMLRSDMDRVAQLVNAEVAQLLIGFMTDTGPTGLNAVKFWLSTHADEFKEGAEITIKTDGRDQITKAIRDIYGVSINVGNDRAGDAGGNPAPSGTPEERT